MAYHIISSDSNKIILERDATGFAVGLFVGVGSFFLLIGIGLNIFMDTWEQPYILFRILFPLMGSIAIAAGLYLPKQARDSIPEQIIFDHVRGAVTVAMNKTTTEVGHIRYDEIAGFEIHIEKQSSTSSTNSNQASTTYYSYHVLLKKKDGGEWFLMQYNSQEKAEAAKALLLAQIPLVKPCTIINPGKLSAKLSKQDGIDKTVIHWQNKVSFLTPIFLTLFSLMFGFVFYSIFSTVSSQGDIDFFMYGVGGFILLVFVFVMFSVVSKFLKDASTRYAISVSKEKFEYYEFSKSDGKMKNQKSLPIATVDRIVYSYSPTNVQNNSTLFVLTQSNAAHLEKVKEKPLASLKDIFSNENEPISLSITALNPVECLQLESWLQELILKRASTKVL